MRISGLQRVVEDIASKFIAGEEITVGHLTKRCKISLGQTGLNAKGAFFQLIQFGLIKDVGRKKHTWVLIPNCLATFYMKNELLHEEAHKAEAKAKAEAEAKAKAEAEAKAKAEAEAKAKAEAETARKRAARRATPIRQADHSDPFAGLSPRERRARERCPWLY